jgi:uncharacterized membrane protein (DUF485 family)
MDAIEIARIKNNSAFQELVRKRSSFGWSLAILMFVIYMAFIFLVAFDHSLVAGQIGSGPVTLAFPLGLGVIVIAIVLTGIYVWRANTEFEALTQEIVGQSRPVRAPVGVRMAGVR